MATYAYGAPLARASAAFVRPLLRPAAVAWFGVVAGLALLMAALLIGPRVHAPDQVATCVGNVDLPGPFGLSLNCDSPQLMALARDPSALLERDNARQARPGLIAAAAILHAPFSLLMDSNGPPAHSVEQGLRDPGAITRSLGRDLPAYLIYVALNVALLLASFYVLRLILAPWAGRDLAAAVIVAASGLMLIANDVVKAFVWSPHTQMFNLLVPLLALHATLRTGQGAMNDWRFALAIGAITGLGILAYPVFVVVVACVVPVAVVIALRHRRLVQLALRNVALLLALSAAPSLLWYLYVRSVTGSFFQFELALGEVVWMANSWAKGLGFFILDWLDKARLLVGFALPQAVAVAALVLLVVLVAMRAPRVRTALRSVTPVALAALYVSFAVLGFYTCVGWTVPRLAYPIIPPLLAAAAAGVLALVRELDRTNRWRVAAACLFLAATQIAYVAAKGGPWS